MLYVLRLLEHCVKQNIKKKYTEVNNVILDEHPLEQMQQLENFPCNKLCKFSSITKKRSRENIVNLARN